MTQARALAGRCGIYCGACTIFRAYKDGGELLQQVSSELNVPPEEIVCEGCNGPKGKMWRNCRQCELASCMSSRKVRYCHECPEFDHDGCEKYQRLAVFASRRGENIKEAEAAFRDGGIDSWLMDQDAKWRCEGCSRPISWYEGTCHHCGAPIKKNSR